MAKYLVQTTEVYRVISEEAAQKLIDEAKADTSYQLIKYNHLNSFWEIQIQG